MLQRETRKEADIQARYIVPPNTVEGHYWDFASDIRTYVCRYCRYCHYGINTPLGRQTCTQIPIDERTRMETQKQRRKREDREDRNTGLLWGACIFFALISIMAYGGVFSG